MKIASRQLHREAETKKPKIKISINILYSNNDIR